MFLGSPFSFPFPHLTPLGGGLCLSCLLRAKIERVGYRNLSSRDVTELVSDWTDSEVTIILVLLDRDILLSDSESSSAS